MRRRIKLSTRREVTAAIRQRYQAANRAGKKLILDEFTKVTGYHRKHAIRALTTQTMSEPRSRAARRVYNEAAKEALIVLWEASDRICGKRLKALLPVLLGAMERHGHVQLDDEVQAQLLAMSASTIDRQLQGVREQACGGRKKRHPPERTVCESWLPSARWRIGKNSCSRVTWKSIWLRIVGRGQKAALCIRWC